MRRSRSEVARRQFISLRELAERWSCDRSTVRRTLEGAGVRAFLLGNGRNGMVRYDLTDVERFERECRERPP